MSCLILTWKYLLALCLLWNVESFHGLWSISKLDSRAKPKLSLFSSIPVELVNHNCMNDFILVERISESSSRESGLVTSVNAAKDTKMLGRVLSVPTTDLHSDISGRKQSASEVIQCRVDDVVCLKDPWGIGPMNIQLGPRYFSFHCADHVVGVVNK